MRRSGFRMTAAAVLIGVLTLPCLTLPCLAQPAGPGPSTMPPMQGSMSAADRDLMQGMQRMQQSMNVKPTGDADRDFVAMMIPHHQGAIDMADVELRYGKDPQMRRLAAEIVKAQRTEVAEMRHWQAQHQR